MTHVMRCAFGCLVAMLVFVAPAVGAAECALATNGVDLAALPVGQACTLPTFHSMSLYYNLNPIPTDPSKVFVRYRKGTEAWKQGYELWCDSRSDSSGLSLATCRGSVVYLQPNTTYEFQFAIASSYDTADWTNAPPSINGTTWNTRPDNVGDNPTTNHINPLTTTNLTISSGGDATSGYQVWDGWNGSGYNTIDVGISSANCININASYVVVKRVVCRGGNGSGIKIADGIHHVVIEDVEVTDYDQACLHTISPDVCDNHADGWGSVGQNDEGAIKLGSGSNPKIGHNSKIVVQRSKLHTPRYGARPWDTGGASGPYGIFVEQADRQNVFRYNEIYSVGTDHQWFQDGIGGSVNASDKGAPGADSDIYHNIIRNMMDDGIEAEGGGRNVRIWGNYIDHAAAGIATTVANYGPVYTFRNVINRLRFYHMLVYPTDSAPYPDADDNNSNRGKAFKAYGSSLDDANVAWGGGRQYIFNNTLLQQPKETYNPQQRWDLGAGEGIAGGGSAEPLLQTWSRNNILQVWRATSDSIRTDGGTTNNLGSDLYNGTVEQSDVNGIPGTPTYRNAHGWNAFPRLTVEPNGPTDPNEGSGLSVGLGQFQLQNTAPTSAGLNAGEALPNFTYDIDNVTFAQLSGVQISAAAPCIGSACPDIGAHDSESTQPMKFGLATAPNLTVTTTPAATPASPATAYVVGSGWGTGNVTANVSGGQSPFTYSWVALDLGYVTYSTAHSATATLNVWTQSCDSNTGHFRVTVTDAAGSSNFADVYFRAWSTKPSPGHECF